MGIYAGNGHDAEGEYGINAYLVSEDGTAGGAILKAVFIKRYRSSGLVELVEEVPAQLNLLGSTEVVEFTIPNSVMRMGDLDDDTNTSFVFVDTELEGTMNVVRQGRKTMKDSEFKELLFNSIARDDVVDNLNPMFETLTEAQ